MKNLWLVVSVYSPFSTWCRKKRKWDQPADSVVAAGVVVSGANPLGNVGSLAGILLPGAAPISGALLTNPHMASCATIPPVFQVPLVVQNTAVVVPKPNQVRCFIWHIFSSNLLMV